LPTACSLQPAASSLQPRPSARPAQQQTDQVTLFKNMLHQAKTAQSRLFPFLPAAPPRAAGGRRPTFGLRQAATNNGWHRVEESGE